MSTEAMRAALRAVLTDIRTRAEGGLSYETIKQVAEALHSEPETLTTIAGETVDLRTPWRGRGWGCTGPGRDGGPGGGRG